MSNVSAWSKVNLTWRQQGYTAVKVAGQWRPIARSFVRVGGVWRTAGLGVPPPKPTLQRIGMRTFQIVGYIPSFNYQARFAVGSGTASLNTSTGVYSIPQNSGFFVSAAYAAGAPRSQEAYMEVKQVSRFRVQVGTGPSYTCGEDCRDEWRSCGRTCPELSGGNPVYGDCGCYEQPSGPSFAQCGIPGPMCWYGGTTRVCTPITCPGDPIFKWRLIDERGNGFTPANVVFGDVDQQFFPNEEWFKQS